MEKSVLRYALDNLIQGTNLVNQHSDFTEYTREDIVSVVNYLLNDGHTLENNFKKRLVHIIETIYNQEFKVENMPEVKWFLVDRKIYTRFCFNSIHMEYAIPTGMLNMTDEQLVENKKLVGRYR